MITIKDNYNFKKNETSDNKRGKTIFKNGVVVLMVILMRNMQKAPEMAHRLLELVTESALRYIDAVCELDLLLSIAEPTATRTIISARHFREFAVLYLRKYVERMDC